MRLVTVMIGVIGLVLASGIRADDTRLAKINLEETPGERELVRARLSSDWIYFIDVQACVCWLTTPGSAGASMVDCTRLKAHPALASHVAKCR